MIIYFKVSFQNAHKNVHFYLASYLKYKENRPTLSDIKEVSRENNSSL